MPHVEYLGEGQLRLRYDNNSARGTIVPGTLNGEEGLLNFSMNSSQLLNRVVMLTWEQYSRAGKQRSMDLCDVWSLDNVAVTLHHNNCVRTVFSDDFEEQQ